MSMGLLEEIGLLRFLLVEVGERGCGIDALLHGGSVTAPDGEHGTTDIVDLGERAIASDGDLDYHLRNAKLQ